jgi:SAM-dependent methyltransferase
MKKLEAWNMVENRDNVGGREPTYDDFAAVYDSLYQRPCDLAEDRVVAEWLRAHGAFDAARILDLGCGTGHLLHMAWMTGALPSPRGFLGIDIAERMVERAVERWPRYMWMTMAAEDFAGTWVAGEFDVVTCTFESWNWIDHERVLPGLHRIMPPGGRLYVVAVGPLQVVQKRPHQPAPPPPFRWGRQRALLRRHGFGNFDLRGMTSPIADRLPLAREGMLRYLRVESRIVPHWASYWKLLIAERL